MDGAERSSPTMPQSTPSFTLRPPTLPASAVSPLLMSSRRSASSGSDKALPSPRPTFGVAMPLVAPIPVSINSAASATSAMAGQEPLGPTPAVDQWRCSTCNNVKDLSGDHLRGRATVRSDCWPCGRKRVFAVAAATDDDGDGPDAIAARASVSTQCGTSLAPAFAGDSAVLGRQQHSDPTMSRIGSQSSPLSAVPNVAAGGMFPAHPTHGSFDNGDGTDSCGVSNVLATSQLLTVGAGSSPNVLYLPDGRVFPAGACLQAIVAAHMRRMMTGVKDTVVTAAPDSRGFYVSPATVVARRGGDCSSSRSATPLTELTVLSARYGFAVLDVLAARPPTSQPSTANVYCRTGSHHPAASPFLALAASPSSATDAADDQVSRRVAPKAVVHRPAAGLPPRPFYQS